MEFSYTDLIKLISDMGLIQEVINDGVTSFNGKIHAIYRVILKDPKGSNLEYIGVASGEVDNALFNATAKAINMIPSADLNISLKDLDDVEVESYKCPFGKYKGLTLDKIPVEYLVHWSVQQKTGTDLDLLISKARETLKGMNNVPEKDVDSNESLISIDDAVIEAKNESEQTILGMDAETYDLLFG